MHENAQASQLATFQALIKKAANTRFGREHGFAAMQSPKDFQQKVPVRDYEAAKEWFEAIKSGEADVSWPGKPLYLAKTSGTTYRGHTRQHLKWCLPRVARRKEEAATRVASMSPIKSINLTCGNKP